MQLKKKNGGRSQGTSKSFSDESKLQKRLYDMLPPNKREYNKKHESVYL